MQGNISRREREKEKRAPNTMMTDLQIRYTLDREYVFEQMMPPGAAFGNYRFIGFPPRKGRVRIRDAKQLHAPKGTGTGKLEALIFDNDNAYTLEALVSRFREEKWYMQTAEREFECTEDPEKTVRFIFRRLGKIVEEGTGAEGNRHIAGYLYLEGLKPRDTRSCDTDSYRYVCRIPVYCDCTLHGNGIRVRCHGVQTGYPDENGHAVIGNFPHPVMADVHPAYRALEKIEEVLSSGEEDGESFEDLRKRERHAYNLKYTAIKGMLSYALLPFALSIAAACALKDYPSEGLAVFLAGCVSLVVILCLSALYLYGKSGRLLTEIQERDRKPEGKTGSARTGTDMSSAVGSPGQESGISENMEN